MADLLDIAPSTAVEVVKIDGQRYTVRGVSVDALAAIVVRFPDLKVIVGGETGDMVQRLIAGCGAAAGPIIAAGFGRLGDAEYERRAATLLPEYQLKFIRAIFGLTFPNGIGSFVQEFTNLMMGGADEGATKVHRVRLKPSPSMSQSSSDADSRPTMQ